MIFLKLVLNRCVTGSQVLNCCALANIKLACSNSGPVKTKKFAPVISCVFSSDGSEKSVDYDLEELGCPIIWAYDEDFLPDLWIFDNGVSRFDNFAIFYVHITSF